MVKLSVCTMKLGVQFVELSLTSEIYATKHISRIQFIHIFGS
jgi:hypothetical protein